MLPVITLLTALVTTPLAPLQESQQETPSCEYHVIVHMKNITTGKKTAIPRPLEVVDEGVFKVTGYGDQGRYHSSMRFPVVTYTFDAKGWKASTTFQSIGTTIDLKPLERTGTQDAFSYNCEVILVVANQLMTGTPVIGRVSWYGSVRRPLHSPLVLKAKCRVNRHVLVPPPNHPLYDPEIKVPEKDLLKEITFTLEIAKKTGN